MRTFLTLFKHERRSLFPSLNLKKKPDIIGGLFSLLISALVIGIFLFMVSTVTKNYVAVKVDKITDPLARSAELLTVLYAITILALTALCLEKMRNTLASKTGKDIFLRLPVSPKSLFLSKLLALMLWNYTTAIFLILPINAIFYVVLEPGVSFLINTAFIVVFLPSVSFLIATVLLIPYIHVIGFLSRHYFITFVILSGALIGAFYLYKDILEVVRTLLETGSIKFLFNQKFVDAIQTIQKLSFPANTLANLALGNKFISSIITLSVIMVISVVMAVVITSSLYRITLYSTAIGRVRRGKRHIIHLPPMLALIRKEFISVFRNPKYLFSYFSIALSMPFMIYCCYTLFHTLLMNAIGRSFELALTVSILLVFGILTNTFCATNISRDGKSALKMKIFPMSPSSILMSKILFCNIISSISVIASGAFLWWKAGISMKSMLIATAIGLIFSISQILISTRMDLNHARVSQGPAEAEKASNRTIAKTVTIGLVFALVTGAVTLFSSAFSGTSPSFLGGITIEPYYSYLIPIVISVLYLLLSILYCFTRVTKAFNKLAK